MVAKGQDARWNEGKEHDSSGAGEEGYASLCAGCEDSERNGITVLYCVKSGWWEHGLREKRWWKRLQGLEVRN